MDLSDQFGVTLGHEPANPKPLKPGQTSQGTLFRQPKPTAEHRYAAKGYTPERREAIAALIPKPTVSAVFSSPGGGKEGVFPSKEQAGGTEPQRTRTHRAIVDIVARSTVPTEHIEANTPKIRVTPGSSWGQMQVKYTQQQGSVVARQGTMKLDPGGGPGRSRGHVEHTVIHEFGHHADFQADPVGFVRTYNTDKFVYRGSAPPSLEGAAEGYAAKHYVPRRNAPAASREYKDLASYPELHQKPAFRRRFEEVSGRPLDEAMGHSRPPSLLGDQFQGSLFHGPGSVGNYVKTWEKPHQVGTIKVGG